MFLAANRKLSSMSEENWELKLKHFKRLGFFFEENTMSTFRRTSQVFVVSERKIKEVTEFLIRRKKIDISFTKSHPAVLICCDEHSLKPRLLVFEISQSKNLLCRKDSLTPVLRCLNSLFFFNGKWE